MLRLKEFYVVEYPKNFRESWSVSIYHMHPSIQNYVIREIKDTMMGTKVGLALKILCKFQMGQLQDQKPRRSRKQCKVWCNPLGMKLAKAQQSKWVWKKENQFWSTWYKLWKIWLREVWAYCYSRLSIY